MKPLCIKTTSWFTPLPDDHLRIGISRGTPRGIPAGYRTYRKLAPGPWFHSVEAEQYDCRYRTEILAPSARTRSRSRSPSSPATAFPL